MKYRARTFYTAEQKAEMCDRWQRGESPHAIARLFDRGHSSIFGQLAPVQLAQAKWCVEQCDSTAANPSFWWLL